MTRTSEVPNVPSLDMSDLKCGLKLLGVHCKTQSGIRNGEVGNNHTKDGKFALTVGETRSNDSKGPTLGDVVQTLPQRSNRLVINPGFDLFWSTRVLVVEDC